MYSISIPCRRSVVRLPGRPSSQIGRPAGGPERAERSEAAEVVVGGDEAARRLPRRQDLPECVQRLHPQLVRLHAIAGIIALARFAMSKQCMGCG